MISKPLPLPPPAMQTISDYQYKLQQNRSHIAREYNSLSDSLNIAKRLDQSIQKKPWTWISSLFFVGVALPWFLKKSTPITSQELQLNPSLENKKKSSFFSKSTLIATSLLKDKTLQLGLISVARLLLPLAQEALLEFGARKKNRRKYSSPQDDY